MTISFVHFSLIGIDQTTYYTAEINMTTVSLLVGPLGRGGVIAHTQSGQPLRAEHTDKETDFGIYFSEIKDDCSLYVSATNRDSMINL